MLGQLEAAPSRIVAGQVSGDFRGFQRRQCHQQAPAQQLVPVGAADQCLVAQHATGGALEPLPRQDHVVVGGNAVPAMRATALRETAEQPALQSRMRHHDRLRGERIARPPRFKLLRQFVGQPLGAAAAMDDQSAWVFLHPCLP